MKQKGEIIISLKIKCDNCQKEVNIVEIDAYNIRISNDTSYRYGSIFLCVECSEKSEIYTTKSFYESLMIITNILKKKENIEVER